MNNVKRLFLMIMLAFTVSIASLPAMAMICKDKGGTSDYCTSECSGLIPVLFPFLICF